MGKRKSKDANYLKEKIRKLEDKLRKLAQDSEEDSNKEESSCHPSSQQYTPPPPSATRTIVVEESPSVINETENNYADNDQLPEEFLLALGKEGEEKEEFGDPIRPELALRWTKIMAEGLGKDGRDKLCEKYPTPSNFINAVAPIMNAELLATLSELSVKRDKRIINRQNLTGKLMTCLGRSLTNILKGDINSKKLIEEVNDAAKIAAEIHHQDSSSRKFFALSGASKTIQEAVKNTKIDTYLFGIDCNEKIKAAQSIQRTSTQIAERKTKSTPSTSRNRQLNWRGPPQNNQQYQQARGGQFQQNKKQPRFNRPYQTRPDRTRPRPPIKSKHRHYR